MKFSTFLSLATILTSSLVSAKSQSCGNGQNCPEDSPCCSQYGECGVGLYCLGACDVRHSFNTSSCVPLPVCQSKDYKFTSADLIVDQTKYLGDNSQYGWTTNGQVLEYDGNVLLTMANQSYGTVISSTSAVWYGKVSATLKTSHGNGVVSAFILMSPSKDEIDYEFVGVNVEQAQTNFYYQGLLNYTNGAAIALSATDESFHTYEFDWTEDRIQWLIDGQVARTLNKADTYNSSSGEYMFPQTPGIVQLSLWPGGSSLNAEGTVDWAGGPINWDMPEFTDPGYLYVTLKNIKVECYDPPSGTTITGKSSYTFTSGTDLTQDSVEITDDNHILGSFLAVGFDPEKGKDDKEFQTVSAVPATKLGGNDAYKDVTLVASQVEETKKTTATSTKSLIDVTGRAATTSKTSTKDIPTVSGDISRDESEDTAVNESTKTESAATTDATADSAATGTGSTTASTTVTATTAPTGGSSDSISFVSSIVIILAAGSATLYIF